MDDLMDGLIYEADSFNQSAYDEQQRADLAERFDREFRLEIQPQPDHSLIRKQKFNLLLNLTAEYKELIFHSYVFNNVSYRTQISGWGAKILLRIQKLDESVRSKDQKRYWFLKRSNEYSCLGSLEMRLVFFTQQYELDCTKYLFVSGRYSGWYFDVKNLRFISRRSNEQLAEAWYVKYLHNREGNKWEYIQDWQYEFPYNYSGQSRWPKVWSLGHEMHNIVAEDDFLSQQVYFPIANYEQRARAFHLECRRLFGYVDDPLDQVHEFDQ